MDVGRAIWRTICVTIGNPIGGIARTYASGLAQREPKVGHHARAPTLEWVRVCLDARLRFVAATYRGSASGRFQERYTATRTPIRYWQLEQIPDKHFELGLRKIYRRLRFLSRGGRRSREFTGTCELQGGFQTKLSTLFDCDRLGADRHRGVRHLEEVAVNRIAVVHDDFLERRYFEPLQLAQRERFDLGEIPLV